MRGHVFVSPRALEVRPGPCARSRVARTERLQVRDQRVEVAGSEVAGVAVPGSTSALGEALADRARATVVEVRRAIRETAQRRHLKRLARSDVEAAVRLHALTRMTSGASE